MVVRANHAADGIGGHLATFAHRRRSTRSASTTSSGARPTARPATRSSSRATPRPAIYARAFLEGRLSEEQLELFPAWSSPGACQGRRATRTGGLSSYPHPRLMPDFWEFPTVSMGLGPAQRHLPGPLQPLPAATGTSPTRSQSRVWCFLGDGECDEPETLGALSLRGREQLDNLTFIVNCNLQRLDGPVRGNGKIIQELEATFRGAGWNVIKVVWGSKWDELLARDVDGVLLNKMNTTVDGEFQKFATEDGAYIREHFFGPDPRLRRLVEHLSRRRPAQPAPRRPRLPQALRRLQGGHRDHRPAHGHPGQDHQGLDARARDRGPQLHPPDQEDERGPAPRPARPPVPPGRDPRQRA